MKGNKWKTPLEKLEWLVSMCEQHKWQVSHSYRGWLLCGYCTASFGAEGRPYFHRLSVLSPKYIFEENEYQFEQCLKAVKDKDNIGLLFRALSEIGINVKDYFSSQSFINHYRHYDFAGSNQ